MKFSIKFSEIMIITMLIIGILSAILIFNLPSISIPSTHERKSLEGYWTGISQFDPERDFFSYFPIKGIVFESNYECNVPFSKSEVIEIELIAHKEWNPNISIITVDYIIIELLFADELQNVFDFQILNQINESFSFNLESSNTDLTHFSANWEGSFPINTKYVGIKLIGTFEVFLHDNSTFSFSDVDLVMSTPNIPIEDNFIFNHNPVMYVLTIALVLSFIGSIISWKIPSVSRSFFLLAIGGALCVSTLIAGTLDVLPPQQQTFYLSQSYDRGIFLLRPFQIDVKIVLEDVRPGKLYRGTFDFNFTFHPDFPLRGFAFEPEIYYPSQIDSFTQEAFWTIQQTSQFSTTLKAYQSSRTPVSEDDLKVFFDYLTILNNGTVIGSTGITTFLIEEEATVQILPSLNPLKLFLSSASFIITAVIFQRSLIYLYKKSLKEQ
ncbi:MAG: hypothetical protein ACFFC7_12720 [Candidatus Hermodarchaeota archaeon]